MYYCQLLRSLNLWLLRILAGPGKCGSRAALAVLRAGGPCPSASLSLQRIRRSERRCLRRGQTCPEYPGVGYGRCARGDGPRRSATCRGRKASSAGRSALIRKRGASGLEPTRPGAFVDPLFRSTGFAIGLSARARAPVRQSRAPWLKSRSRQSACALSAKRNDGTPEASATCADKPGTRAPQLSSAGPG